MHIRKPRDLLKMLSNYNNDYFEENLKISEHGTHQCIMEVGNDIFADYFAQGTEFAIKMTIAFL